MNLKLLPALAVTLLVGCQSDYAALQWHSCEKHADAEALEWSKMFRAQGEDRALCEKQLAECRTTNPQPAEIVHRYEVNMNLLKVPGDQPTIYGSAFVSSCTEQDLNTVRDWLAKHVTADCPNRVELEKSMAAGISAGGK